MKDLIGLEGLAAAEILSILDRAADFKRAYAAGKRRWKDLEDRTVALLFYEPSTRTRFSFELAAKRLSAHVLAFDAQASSVVKGETLADTLKNLEAMGVDAFVIRHADSGAARFAALSTQAGVINAGDGAHEHPTQALLDFMTIREYKRKFEGLKVVYVGDILHSRVARSGIFGLAKLGAKVAVCGPPTLVPDAASALGVDIFYDLDRSLQGADAVVALRIQLERIQENLFPSLTEYAKLYCLTPERLKAAKSDCIVLHPGPMNRGVEISDSVADGEHSVILEQVKNGVFVRMAVLSMLLRHQKEAASFSRLTPKKETASFLRGGGKDE